MQKEISYFNPRLREGGDIGKTNTGKTYTDFNPRLREGGDALLMLTQFTESLNFNPRLREGGDDKQYKRNIIKFISIHASEKEATSCLCFFRYDFTISIHASEKEATNNCARYCFAYLFQSTPPRRRRQIHINLKI